MTDVAKKLGIEFVPASINQLSGAQTLFMAMAEQQAKLVKDDPSLMQLSAQVRPFMIEAFLANPLTPEQIAHINETETPNFARSCVDFQTQVAKVPIWESMEPMQNIPAAFEDAHVNASFSDEPFPEGSGQWTGKPQEYWARESVVKRLIVTGQILDILGLQLHFLEAFRPPGVQEAMFKRRLQTTSNEHPEWTKEDIIAETKSKTASTPRLASHKGGAAVDMFISSFDGILMDFGHSYPNGGVLVSPFNPYLTYEQWRNRQLLNVATSLAGLTMYMGEDWHFSFGDNVAATESLHTSPDAFAQFGPIKDFDRESGAITDIYSVDELDDLFSG